MRILLSAALLVVVAATASYAQTTGPLVVTVHSAKGAVAGAEVTAGGITSIPAADGTVTFTLPPGRVDVIVTKEDFDPGAAPVQIRAGMESRLEVALEP